MEKKDKVSEALRAIANTPTFELSPIHKPDMSQYLIHLTSHDNLINIIKGVGTAQVLKKLQGFLKSSLPNYANCRYHNKVVSFTESPLYALDFFRLRSLARFNKDQQYGIGFSKSALVKQGVRPVLYLDTEMNRNFLGIISNVENGVLKISSDDVKNEYLKAQMSKLKSLMFPMFETSEKQGYMWEREWRWPNGEGMVFNHSDIRVICCPKSDQDDLKKLLPSFLENICFVENWNEYKDYTLFIKSKNELPKKEDISEIFDINELRLVQERYMQMLENLEIYQSNFTDLESHDWESIEKAKKNLSENLQISEQQEELIYQCTIERTSEMESVYSNEMQAEMEKDFQVEYYRQLQRDVEADCQRDCYDQ